MTIPPATIIQNATLITLDEAGTVIEPGDLAIRGDRIEAVGPAGSIMNTGSGEVIDGTGKVVMPGFSNCHTHSYAALLKGSVDRQPLDVFMLNAILGAGGRSARDAYLAAQVAALEMLTTGSTACLDHFSHRPKHDPEVLDAVLQAYADAGVRATVAPMFSDLPFVETIPLEPGEMDEGLRGQLPGSRQPFEPYFEMMEEAVRRWSGDSLVALMLGVDSPQRCTEPLLTKAGAFCAEHGIGNHTHLLEAKTQWAMADKRDPRGFVAYLADFGLAGPKSSFAHFIWFTDADLEHAAHNGVGVVHNPASNLILGSGLQPLVRLVEAGVPVAFGSDGLNAGHMGMFEKTRLAALLPRVCETDPDRWPTAAGALRMATVNGARILGRGGDAGELKEGQLADIVILDGQTVALSPRGDVQAQVVFHETGASVTDVFVGGAHVLRNGAPSLFDGAAILAEASEAARRIAHDSRERLAEAEKFRPGLVAMVRRILESSEGPCRFASLG